MGLKSVRYNLALSTSDGCFAGWTARQLINKWGSEAISASSIVREPGGEARILTTIKDYKKVSPDKVLEEVILYSRQFNIEVVEADIVGDVPVEAILPAAERLLRVKKIRRSQLVW